MGHHSISDYDPIKFFFPSGFQEKDPMSSPSLDHYDPLEEVVDLNIKDESLKSSTIQILEDFKNMMNHTNTKPLFFSDDVIDNDLFNIKSVPDLKNCQKHFEPLLIDSNNKSSLFKAFDSNLSNICLERVIDQFDHLDLSILTVESVEKLKHLKKTCENSQRISIIADEKLELDIKKVNITRNPEEVAWAVQNNALVAFKEIKATFNSNEQKETEGEESFEIRLEAKWASLTNRYINRINVYNQEGQLQRTFNEGEFHTTEFTAAETEYIFKLAFIAIHISFYLKKEEAKTKEKIKKNIENQSPLLEKSAIEYENEKQKVKFNYKFNFLILNSPGSRFSIFQRIFQKIQEKAKEEEEIEEAQKKAQDLKYRIIQKEILITEIKQILLKLDIIKKFISQFEEKIKYNF